jgi:uncharacterized membrane protein
MQKTVSNFLVDLKLPISKTYCENLIASHAHYPSLLSIADALDTLGIKNVAGLIEKEKLQSLPFPYLLQLNTGSGDVIAIKNAKDLISKSQHLEMWDGVVLQIEQPTTIQDEENNHLYKKEKFIRATSATLGVALTALLIWPIASHYSTVSALLILTSLIGAAVGYLLVAKELGTKYSLVENFCMGGANSDCDKILNSENAKLFGDVKLSDAVLAYFIFQTVFLIVSATWMKVSSTIFSTLSILSFLSIPVVLYSLYYQKFVAKTWCRLCLIVDGVLAIQLFIFGYLFANENTLRIPNLNYNTVLVETASFIIIGCIVIILKNVIEKNNNVSKEFTRSLRVKNNASVFGHLLMQQKRSNTGFMEHEILLGEHIDAPVKIIMVSNLYCNPCKRQHKIIEELINMFPDKMCVALRFVVSKDSAANHYLIQYWLKHFHNKRDESFNTLRLLHEWYELMDLEKFKEKFPMELAGTHPVCEEIIRQHVSWNKKQKTHRTPTFFINGYQLPETYEMKDLKHLVMTLAAESKSTATEPVTA